MDSKRDGRRRVNGNREWSILELARLVGVTRRTLRHYAEIGLLTPTRVSKQGYRYYGEAELLRLQRVLLLREMGFGLPAIREVVDRSRDDVSVSLRRHLEWLRIESSRLNRQLRSVERTLERLEKGEPLMAREVLDGFEPSQYREEVVQRWGADAYAAGSGWWKALSDAERAEFQRESRRLMEDWGDAKRAGVGAHSAEAQELASRHVAWLRSVPGTPAHAAPTADAGLRRYVEGLAHLYVDDPRFGRSYDRHAPGTAKFVRDALVAWCESAASASGESAPPVG